MLKSFATARRWPKRGYAIVRCALDLGLRAGEIARLMISDVDWHVGTVMLRGTKSLRHYILPLPIETGQALADYLQHERPHTSNPGIFIRCQGERDQPISSMAIQKVIKRAGRRIGLIHFSAHALRRYSEFRTMPSVTACALESKLPAVVLGRTHAGISA